jgi:hypothetical protein
MRMVHQARLFWCAVLLFCGSSFAVCGSVPGKDLGKLDGDVAPPDDDGTLGGGGEEECLVRGDDVLRPLKLCKSTIKSVTILASLQQD